METLNKPVIKVTYNNKDITQDISNYLLSFTYVDKVEGETDELTITLEDTDLLWQGEWYPEKGAKLIAEFGYNTELVSAGTFEIDEIELTGPPDTVTIRALAAAVTGTLRTVRSQAYEKTTLQKIAETIASRNKLTIIGDIEAINFERVTQNRETDLSFLRRIAAEYGTVFSVRGEQLVFTTIYDLEEASSVKEVDKTELIGFGIKDKTSSTFNVAKVTYHDPVTKTVVDAEYQKEEKVNADGVAFTEITKGDTKVIHSKAENKQQAELKAKAALHNANSRQQEGRINLPGSPLLVAGNNFELTGLGMLSGKYHIISSSHSISRSGYTTELEIKKVGYIEKVKQKPKKKKTDNTQYKVVG